MNPLEFDPADFRRQFEKDAFFLKHSLASHPLFTQTKMIELANSLAPERRLLNTGNVPISMPEGGKSTDGLSVEETIKRIGELKTWVGLKMISRHPEYRALIDEVLDQVKPQIDLSHPGMFEREAHLVISSPHSVTPYHLDSEHVFLFHIQGRKEFTIFDPSDRELVSEIDLEQYHSRVDRRMVLPDHLVSRGKRLILNAGDAVHIPVQAPHFVRTFDEVCISMTITFRTPATYRRGRLHSLNHALRRMRLNPSPVGLHPWRDYSKFALFESYCNLRQLTQR